MTLSKVRLQVRLKIATSNFQKFLIYQKKNSSLNVVELWVTKETDESEVQSALRKYQQQGIFVCIFRSGTKDCVELTQELLRINLT